MTDEELIGYLFDALDPSDRAVVEACIHADPDTAARLDNLRLALAPLAAAREPEPLPRPGLATRTVARLAEYLVAHEPTPVPRAPGSPVITEPLPAGEPLASPAPPRSLRAPRDEPEVRMIGGRFRADIFVACGIALFAGGLVFSGIGKVRARQEVLACQNTLRTLHAGLTGYADTHAGHYPQVAPNTTAETFAHALASAGQVPPGFRPGCPAEPPTAFVGYTYTLGYRTPTGVLLGLRRQDGAGDESELMPIVADYPAAAIAPATGPVSPHGTNMNVLCIGGNVRLTTSPLIGPNRDDIYRNAYGFVAAGVDRTDVVLGRPGDVP
jgi:hypothetical protein